MGQTILIRTVAALALLLTLSACQTKELPPVTDEEISQLALEIEPGAIQIMAALKDCSTLGGDLAQQAKEHYRSWLEQNTKLIEASELYLAQSRHDWVQWQGLNLSLHSLRQYYDITKQTLARQNLANRGSDARHDICYTAFLKAENFVPQTGKERIISALYERAQTIEIDASGVLLLSDLLPVFPEPGKSVYQITQALSSACSEPVETIPLVNEWPVETYAAYCMDAGLALVECDWGKCKMQNRSENLADLRHQ